MRGEFHFLHDGKTEIIQNTICKDGAQMFLQSLFQAGAVMPTNYYMGLTSAALDFNSVLTDAEAGEPSGHGYARQTLVRDNTDWTVELVNGIYRARSKDVTFTASSDWATTYSRAFIANVASGVGKLVCASGPTASPIQVLNALGPVTKYIFNLNG